MLPKPLPVSVDAPPSPMRIVASFSQYLPVLWRVIFLFLFSAVQSITPANSCANTTQPPLASRTSLPQQPCAIDPLNTWSDPEQWAWIEICEGRDVAFEPHIRTKPALEEIYNRSRDPCDKFSLQSERGLGRNFLSTILTTEPFRSALPNRRVGIVGAFFFDGVSLRDVSLAHRLVLSDSLFGLGPTPFGASIDFLELTSTKAIHINKSIVLGPVNFSGSRIGGNVAINKTELRWPLAEKSTQPNLAFIEAQLDESLSISRSTIPGNLSLGGAIIARKMAFTGSKFQNVNLDSSIVRGGIYARKSKFSGTFRMGKALVENGS